MRDRWLSSNPNSCLSHTLLLQQISEDTEFSSWDLRRWCKSLKRRWAVTSGVSWGKDSWLTPQGTPAPIPHSPGHSPPACSFLCLCRLAGLRGLTHPASIARGEVSRQAGELVRLQWKIQRVGKADTGVPRPPPTPAAPSTLVELCGTPIYENFVW